MSEVRRLVVANGRVQCTLHETVTVDRCGFCAHSVRVVVRGREMPSPARAYCGRCLDARPVDMAKVEEIVCDDLFGEGFRSIANIIS